MYKTLIRPAMIFIPLCLGQLIPQAHILGKTPYNCIKYALMIMLFLSFLKIEWRELKFRREHFLVAGCNLLMGIVPYFLMKSLLSSQPGAAEAAFFIGITPTATAAPVVVSFLNGRTGFALTGFILSSAVVSLALFFLLPVVAGKVSAAFLLEIFLTLFQVMLIPFLAALAVKNLWKGAKEFSVKCKTFSFLLWSFTLLIMSASARQHFIENPGESSATVLVIAASAVILCLCNFTLGNLIARRKYKRETSQILGQKNTSFTMFLALQFSTPLAALGPIFYIVCHNTWNAVQFFRYDRRRRMRQERMEKEGVRT